MLKIKNNVISALYQNLDGTPNDSAFTMITPAMEVMKSYSLMSEMIASVNSNYVVNMVFLSSIVIYSLMLSDVNE